MDHTRLWAAAMALATVAGGLLICGFHLYGGLAAFGVTCLVIKAAEVEMQLDREERSALIAKANELLQDVLKAQIETAEANANLAAGRLEAANDLQVAAEEIRRYRSNADTANKMLNDRTLSLRAMVGYVRAMRISSFREVTRAKEYADRLAFEFGSDDPPPIEVRSPSVCVPETDDEEPESSVPSTPSSSSSPSSSGRDTDTATADAIVPLSPLFAAAI